MSMVCTCKLLGQLNIGAKMNSKIGETGGMVRIYIMKNYALFLRSLIGFQNDHWSQCEEPAIWDQTLSSGES